MSDMDDYGYWHRTFRRRISRRRALQGALALGAGGVAAAAQACGGEEEGEAPPAASPTAPAEGKPKLGGTEHGTVSLVLGFDPIKATTFLTHALASFCYSRLIRYKTVVGDLPQSEWYAVVPELATSWENPDETTFVFTLNPEAA